MNTEALAVLVNAVAGGSLSAAARRLGIPPILAARRLASLEDELGIRLMHRTTRSISLTPEGEAFIPYAQEILDREAAALATLAPGAEGASGLLRVTAPAGLGRYIIIPMLPALLAANPNMRLDLHFGDRVVDLVSEGLDVAIRATDLRESNLIARRIGTLRRVLCAAPSFLASRGRPQTIDDLATLDCLTLLGVTHWSFTEPEGIRRARLSSPISCSVGDALHDACREGLGIGLLPSWMVAEDLRSGRLVELKLDAPPHWPAISAVYPTAKMIAPKLRVFVDALTKALAETEAAEDRENPQKVKDRGSARQ